MPSGRFWRLVRIFRQEYKSEYGARRAGVLLIIPAFVLLSLMVWGLTGRGIGVGTEGGTDC